jgi:NhaP-type Na+/H+ or K+/H+ antiporter
MFARLVSAEVLIWMLQRWERFEPSLIPVLTWAGRKGGISVAVPRSLRDLDGPKGSRGPELIVAMTHVVVFSIPVRGPTVGWLARSWVPQGQDLSAHSPRITRGWAGRHALARRRSCSLQLGARFRKML